jgi:hypothetical protein
MIAAGQAMGPRGLHAPGGLVLRWRWRFGLSRDCMRGASTDLPGAEHHWSILRVIRTNLCATLPVGHDVT